MYTYIAQASLKSAIDTLSCLCSLYIHEHVNICMHIRTHVYIYMGWLQLYVSFAEYRPFYMALLRKKPIILSILLTEATP